MRTSLILVGVWSIVVIGSNSSKAVDDADQARLFDTKVAPILARRCLDCHSGTDPKGKLDLSDRKQAMEGGENGEVIVPGKPEESLLWEQVNSGEMPPKSPLNQEEKTVLREWIAAGAYWGTARIDPYQFTTARRAGRDWWSLQPVVRPKIPTTSRPDWIRSPIDAFVLQNLDANGLTPAPEAERRTLIRRLSFDITGLPPSPEDVDTFLADTSSNAHERVVDRLLSSPQFGVRWARWWLDVARFGESNGFEFDEFRPDAWRYRDWVVKAMNHDMPYNEFVALQIAGDLLKPDDPTAIEATGFLVAGAYDTVGQTQQSGPMKAVVRGDELEDYIGTVTQTFLGLTANCARCHDHKFDPIRQVEYYQLASALGGVRPGVRDLSSLDTESKVLRGKAESLQARLDAIEAPARAQILASRKVNLDPPPKPFAAWDFDRGLEDTVGTLNVTLSDGTTRTSEGLHFDGKAGFARTSVLKRDLGARTIEALVKLDNLDQRGGGVLTLQAGEGLSFDGIVFAEQEPGRWLPGSDNFRRTQSVGAPPETEAKDRAIPITISYSADGSIHMYRNGQPYGKPYKASGLVTYPAEKTEILFGLRHPPTGGNRVLAGTIVRARLYDRALDPSEVAAAVGATSDYVAPAAMIAMLTPDSTTERARLLGEIESLGKQIVAHARTAYAVAPLKPGATQVAIRGNAQQLGEVVSAGGVAALTGIDANFGLDPAAPEGERRKRLSAWVTHRDNPLFARVVVNRIWQAHMGTGLVETASDFGFNAGKPSHPELLDWLAAELVSSGWSLKAIHKAIVMSASYRQSSRHDSTAFTRDAGNRLLWRKSPTRLEAEMVRDAMLWTSGGLDRRLGGPSYQDHGATKALGTAAMLYVPVDPSTPGLDRRTLYRAAARGGRDTFLDAFDCPDPSTITPRRAVTTTPLQALAMMNNNLVLHLSDLLSDRLAKDAGQEPSRQVDRVYRLAYGREPTDEERARAVSVVKEFGAATLARAIFNSSEFLYVD